jgi:hypothetical protein
MGLKTNKPRGRNGGRPSKLNPTERRELGAYAYRLKRGAPIPSFELPSGADGGWQLSKAAKEILNARVTMLSDRDNGFVRAEYVRLAADAAQMYGSKVKHADLRLRQPKQRHGDNQHEQPDDVALSQQMEVRLGPTSRHWVRESILWVDEQYGETVKGDLVREAEREYRKIIGHLERAANEDIG